MSAWCSTRRFTGLLAGLLLLSASHAGGAILVGYGNKPVNDPGWPAGALDVANSTWRVGYWEGPPFGGGEWHFLYRGDTKQFNDTLQLFSNIIRPKLDLIVKDGPSTSPFLRGAKPDEKADNRVDFEFVVWQPENWHRLFNSPGQGPSFVSDHPNFRQPVAPPTLIVYIGGGGVNWDEVKVPATLTVIDQRAGASGVNVEGGARVDAQVFDMRTGKPIAGATVAVQHAAAPNRGDRTEAIADNTGSAQVVAIPAGRVTVTVSAEGYAPRMVAYDELAVGHYRKYIVELAPAAKVSGVVTDTEGKPLSGVNVRADARAIDGRGYNMPDGAQTTTDAEGRFTFNHLPIGAVGLWRTLDGYHLLDPFTLHAAPSENLILKMIRAGAIRGVVVDADGKPVEGGNVSLWQEGNGVGTYGGGSHLGPGGTFEFKNVPPGKYFMSTQSRQLNPTNVLEFNVTSGETSEVKLIDRRGK